MAKKRGRIYTRSETPGLALCPFSVVVDSRESHPYLFNDLYTNEAEGRLLISVPTLRTSLETGDYAIEQFPSGVVIERKSKADLFGSMVDRANIEHRLMRMQEGFESSHWVIEAELSEIHADPPTGYAPKSLVRSVMAWAVRYPSVHWWFCPGRRHAEQWTFRLLEKFWEFKEHGTPF